VPQAQYFFAYINFDDPDSAICPGTKAQIKIHCRWHTTFWFIKRSLSNALDIGLNT